MANETRSCDALRWLNKAASSPLRLFGPYLKDATGDRLNLNDARLRFRSILWRQEDRRKELNLAVSNG